MLFRDKTVLVSGGSRGIGKAIALRLAKEGANIVIAGKTTVPNPKLEGTIHSAAEEIIAATGAKAIAVKGDIRFENEIEEIINASINSFGTIDILINNASAINLSSIENLEAKRFDLMHDINIRGTYLMSKACIPYLKKASNPHILNLSPPINLNPKWFAKHSAYTLSKYGMSMIVIGLAAELKSYNIAANALWPRTTIATAAVQNLLGGDYLIQRSRTAEIVAEAACSILQQPSATCTGNFFIDEEVLQKDGISDFTSYAVNPSQALMTDLFLD